jgi:hypothetical protein
MMVALKDNKLVASMKFFSSASNATNRNVQVQCCGMLKLF